MSFDEWPEEEAERLQQGLRLIGWKADTRLTHDDAAMMKDVADEAIRLHDANQLSSADIDRLAVAAFDIMHFQIMNVGERAGMTTNAYSESKFLSSCVPLIDEALLCYYRGYYTASLAILVIVLESYLRNLLGWQPGMPNPSFAQLVSSVQNLPESSDRMEAAAILDVLYAKYNAASPARFFFNRHGLLHGLRGAEAVDEMNCVRVFILFDLLCYAEGLGRVFLYPEEFYLRHSAYEQCRVTKLELQVMERSRV